MKTYIVVDFEYRVDRDAFNRYLAVERVTPAEASTLHPRDEKATPRWPFRVPVCASWLVLTSGADGVLAPSPVMTASAPEMNEEQVLRKFFDELAVFEDADIVTWGGAATDMPQILAAAMRYGLTLPPLLRAQAEPFNNRQRRHVDLMLAMCGAGARVHLAEVAAALDIPAKPISPPGMVASYVEREKWSSVKAICESDAYTTALILVRYLRMAGTLGTAFGMAHRIAVQAAGQDHRRYAADYASYRDRLLVDAEREASRTHEAVAV